jgi:predicted transcriptional regulator
MIIASSNKFFKLTTTVISFLTRQKLSSTDICVYLTIKSFNPFGDGSRRFKIKELCQILDVSRSTIMRSLRKLKQKQIIKYEPTEIECTVLDLLLTEDEKAIKDEQQKQKKIAEVNLIFSNPDLITPVSNMTPPVSNMTPPVSNMTPPPLKPLENNEFCESKTIKTLKDSFTLLENEIQEKEREILIFEKEVDPKDLEKIVNEDVTTGLIKLDYQLQEGTNVSQSQKEEAVINTKDIKADNSSAVRSINDVKVYDDKSLNQEISCSSLVEEVTIESEDLATKSEDPISKSDGKVTKRRKHRKSEKNNADTPWLDEDGEFKQELVDYLAKQWIEKYPDTNPNIHVARSNAIAHLSKPKKAAQRWREYQSLLEARKHSNYRDYTGYHEKQKEEIPVNPRAIAMITDFLKGLRKNKS